MVIDAEGVAEKERCEPGEAVGGEGVVETGVSEPGEPVYEKYS